MRAVYKMTAQSHLATEIAIIPSCSRTSKMGPINNAALILPKSRTKNPYAAQTEFEFVVRFVLE